MCCLKVASDGAETMLGGKLFHTHGVKNKTNKPNKTNLSLV